MPRLPISLLQKAHAQNPFLPLLLRASRDLPSANNELRWLKQHAKSTVGVSTKRNHQGPEWQALLRRLCEKRARGVPLQYLIGNQPFGDLEILCTPGVLIPRYYRSFNA
jgi:methylase of polypeptide subunit release factors